MEGQDISIRSNFKFITKKLTALYIIKIHNV